MRFLDKESSILGIGYAIAGSMANGKARAYSDIDVLVFMGKLNNVDPIIEFEKPLMVNFTERPKGIVMVTYSKGLCVELDCRDYINKEELNEIVVINDSNMKVNKREVTRKEVTTKYAYQFLYSMDLRLLYKSLLKYLCTKEKDSIGLLQEFENQMGESITIGKYHERVEFLYNVFKNKNDIEKNLHNDIRELIDKAKHRAFGGIK